MTDVEKGKLKLRLKDFLKEHPNNYSAAGRELNLPRSVIVRMVEEDLEMFQDIDEEFFDDLEEKVVLFVSGKRFNGDDLFRLTDAMKVLEKRRPERWGKNAKLKEPEKLASPEQITAMMEQLKAKGLGIAPKPVETNVDFEQDW